MSSSNSNYMMLTAVAIIAIVALFFVVQSQNEPRTPLGKAAEEMADGVEDAADELKPNKPVGEKIGDAVEDAGDNIKDATN